MIYCFVVLRPIEPFYYRIDINFLRGAEPIALFYFSGSFVETFFNILFNFLVFIARSDIKVAEASVPVVDIWKHVLFLLFVNEVPVGAKAAFIRNLRTDDDRGVSSIDRNVFV